MENIKQKNYNFPNIKKWAFIKERFKKKENKLSTKKKSKIQEKKTH